MRSGNHIHVQQPKTNMINEEKEQKNKHPFCHVPSRLFCQMKWQMCRSQDCSGLYSYTPIKPHRSHRPIDSYSKPYLHREKNIGFGTRTTLPAAILRITGKAAFCV